LNTEPPSGPRSFIGHVQEVAEITDEHNATVVAPPFINGRSPRVPIPPPDYSAIRVDVDLSTDVRGGQMMLAADVRVAIIGLWLSS